MSLVVRCRDFSLVEGSECDSELGKGDMNLNRSKSSKDHCLSLK